MRQGEEDHVEETRAPTYGVSWAALGFLIWPALFDWLLFDEFVFMTYALFAAAVAVAVC